MCFKKILCRATVAVTTTITNTCIKAIHITETLKQGKNQNKSPTDGDIFSASLLYHDHFEKIYPPRNRNTKCNVLSFCIL